MTLDEWLTAAKATGMTEVRFAALVGISQPQVNRLRRNLSWPSKDLMARIREATNQKVTPNDWFASEGAA